MVNRFVCTHHSDHELPEHRLFYCSTGLGTMKAFDMSINLGRFFPSISFSSILIITVQNGREMDKSLDFIQLHHTLPPKQYYL